MPRPPRRALRLRKRSKETRKETRASYLWDALSLFMIKYLIGLLVSILAVAFFRAVSGLLTNAVKDAMQPEAKPGSGAPPPSEASTRLRKCKTCGTFAPETRMLRHSTRDAEIFFCSKECEKKEA